jgi:hypothetical protein
MAEVGLVRFAQLALDVNHRRPCRVIARHSASTSSRSRSCWRFCALCAARTVVRKSQSRSLRSVEAPPSLVAEVDLDEGSHTDNDEEEMRNLQIGGHPRCHETRVKQWIILHNSFGLRTLHARGLNRYLLAVSTKCDGLGGPLSKDSSTRQRYGVVIAKTAR